MNIEADKEQELKEQFEFQKQVAELEQLVKRYMTKEAISRYSNLKIVHPELALKVLVLLSQPIQSGQLNEKIGDEEFKNILIQIQPQKKEFKLTKR